MDNERHVYQAWANNQRCKMQSGIQTEGKTIMTRNYTHHALQPKCPVCHQHRGRACGGICCYCAKRRKANKAKYDYFAKWHAKYKAMTKPQVPVVAPQVRYLRIKPISYTNYHEVA